MQSETADFAPAAATWRTRRNLHWFWFISLDYTKTWRQPQNLYGEYRCI